MTSVVDGNDESMSDMDNDTMTADNGTAAVVDIRETFMYDPASNYSLHDGVRHSVLVNRENKRLLS